MKTRFLLAPLVCYVLLCCTYACSKSNAPIEDTKEPVKEEPVPTPPKTTPDHILKDYELAWSDEFNGTTLDLAKWNYRQDGVVRKLGTVSKDAISLDGKGNLLITVNRGADGVYYIGQVSTDGLFMSKYGYYECRAQMQKSLGPHTAFWLQSPTYGRTAYSPDLDGVEIDIFEYHRAAPNRVYFNTHWGGYAEYHQQNGSNYVFPGVSQGYHTFGLEWKEDEYIFYVNGVKRWSTNKSISQVEQYIILSAELTGWGGEPSLGKFPDAIYYDYVRVYKPKAK